MGFPAPHRAKLYNTNPIEPLNGEIKRRTEVVGIFPNEAAVARLVRVTPLEQNDEWAMQRSRWLTLETIAPFSDDPVVGLPAVATWPTRFRRVNAATATAKLLHGMSHDLWRFTSFRFVKVGFSLIVEGECTSGEAER